MAEFLIYDQDNWMDVPSKDRPDLRGYKNVERKILEESGLTIERRTEKLGQHDIKYMRRYQRGDPIEARQDSGPRGNKEEASFIFLQVLGLSLKDAKVYCAQRIDKRRSYYIDLTGLVIDEHKTASLSISQFNSRLKVKK